MDKKSALDTLGKYYQMFKDQIEVDGSKFLNEIQKINRRVNEDLEGLEKKMSAVDADFEVVDE